MRTITRYARVDRVFDQGRSQLLTLVARLSVLYEDFRIEHGALGKIVKANEAGEAFSQYELMYFIRRSLVTMSEVQGTLTMIRCDAEYKARQAWMTNLDRRSVGEANAYLQDHAEIIKKWRNAFGGHFQAINAAAACEKISPNAVGSICWGDNPDGSPLKLKLEFASHIVAGAIAAQSDGEDVETESREALNSILGGYPPVQQATYALVHAFLWDKFGG